MPRMYCSHVAYCTALDVQTLTTSRLTKRPWQLEVELNLIIIDVPPVGRRIILKRMLIYAAPQYATHCGVSPETGYLCWGGYMVFLSVSDSISVPLLLLSVRLPVANAPDVLQPCGLLYYP